MRGPIVRHVTFVRVMSRARRIVLVSLNPFLIARKLVRMVQRCSPPTQPRCAEQGRQPKRVRLNQTVPAHALMIEQH